MLQPKFAHLLGLSGLTLCLSLALFWPHLYAAKLVYYYPVKATHFTTTNTFRASVSTSGQLNAITGQADSTFLPSKPRNITPAVIATGNLTLILGRC